MQEIKNEIKYKEIEFNEKSNVLNLMDCVINNLKRPEFYYMGNKEKELERMFDKSYVYNLGAYYKEKLVGMTQLYVDQEDLENYINISNLKDYNVCELGTALVLEKFRNNGIMQNLIKLQKDKAKSLNFEYMIATAHPENIPSNIALTKSGFCLKKQIMINNNKYCRNLYQMKLN